ncbi:MAG: type II toxin-antitoxin system PemK/MazF family toxin [Cyanobacteria bacterium J06634_6]
MMSTTNHSFGDLLLVPYPCTELGERKKRPAIVISSNAYNQRHKDFILIAVTSHFNTPLPSDNLFIRYWRQAGLLKPSVVKPVIKTFPSSFSLEPIGPLLTKDKDALREFLRKIMG